jgi:hypothetical protein
MAAMAARQEFDDGGGFAMPPHSQHDAFVGPFHGRSLQDSAEGRSYLAQRHSGMVRRTRPHMCNCTSGNLEIQGSMLRIAPE